MPQADKRGASGEGKQVLEPSPVAPRSGEIVSRSVERRLEIQMTGKEKRAKRHSVEHNMKCFAEQQVDKVGKGSKSTEYAKFFCIGEAGEQGDLCEKFNHWIQGYARYERWLGVTSLSGNGNTLELIWKAEPEFAREEDGTVTLQAEVAISGV